MVLVHGGGWEAGDRVTYITPLFEPLARAGFAWCSIDYRLTPQVLNPAQLRDCGGARVRPRSRAREWRIDPGAPRAGRRVGERADGRAGRDRGSRASPAVVSFYGVYDIWRHGHRRLAALAARAPVRAHGRSTPTRARCCVTVFAAHRVHRGMPPVLLVHGTNERLWEQGVAMSRP